MTLNKVLKGHPHKETKLKKNQLFTLSYTFANFGLKKPVMMSKIEKFLTNFLSKFMCIFLPNV
jgi:hypothetical protein